MPLKNTILAVALSIAAAGCDKAERGGPQERSDERLVLAVMPELPPYAYVDAATGEIRGIDIDIVKAAAAILGKPLEIRRVPFSMMIPSVKNKTADFAAGAITIFEGRKRDVDFSDPYAVEGSSFIYRTGRTKPTMTTASTMRVGVVEGMTHDFYLTRHGIDPVRYKSIEEAAKDLETGFLDTVFYDRSAIVHLAEESNGAFSVTPFETRENYGIAVRKDRPDYLEAVNRAIRERKSK